MGQEGGQIDSKPWLGKYRIPAEALRLAEDIQTLGFVLKLLEGVEISDDYETVRKVRTILTGAKRLTEQKLRDEFMAGKPMQRKQKQTMRDVWKQIL